MRQKYHHKIARCNRVICLHISAVSHIFYSNFVIIDKRNLQCYRPRYIQKMSQSMLHDEREPCSDYF
jgi:hypothetical protein